MKLALLMVMKLERNKNKDKKVTQTCLRRGEWEKKGKKKMFYLAYCTGQLVSHGHYNDGPTVLLISVGVLRLKMGFCSFD